MCLVRCTHCGRKKRPTLFHHDVRNKNGLTLWCKLCRAKHARKYRQQHPRKHRDKDLRGRFGITIDEYDTIAKAQKNRCAICRRKPNHTLCVDHDHRNGRVRQLLCRGCNHGLGQFQDRADIILKAADYLKRHKR